MRSENWNDSRDSSRFSLEASAYISINKKLIPGRVKDVSDRAICIRTDHSLPIGANVDVVVMLDHDREIISGYVSRVSAGEIVVSSLARSSGKLHKFFQALARI